MKLVFIQNMVATPYRIVFFNKLSSMGQDLCVLYQSLVESDRDWNIDTSHLHYDYWVDKRGLCLKHGGFYFHINPLLVFKILSLPKDSMIILGGWSSFDSVVVSVLKRLGLCRKKIGIWCEANYLNESGEKPNKGIVNYLRRLVVNSVDGAVIIPGEMSIRALEHFGCKTNNLHYVFLPNMIQDNEYYREEKHSTNSLPTFVIPARLVEKIKGIHNFFNAIGNKNIKRALFLIVGSGDDENLYKKYIEENALQEHIKLLGFKKSSELNKIYNSSDALLLPSFYDSSPLALVEATRIGLPILASNHCGNHFEAIEEGVNGYTFDPLNPSDIKIIFEKFMSEKEKWGEYGKSSQKIYDNQFDANKVLPRFIEDINRIYQD